MKKLTVFSVIAFILAFMIYASQNPNTGNILFFGLLSIGAVILIIAWIVLPVMVNSMLVTLKKIESHLAFQNDQIRKQKSVVPEGLTGKSGRH